MPFVEEVKRQNQLFASSFADGTPEAVLCARTQSISAKASGCDYIAGRRMNVPKFQTARRGMQLHSHFVSRNALA
jgi:hypothetical protein